MAQITKKEIIGYLSKLKKVYTSLDINDIEVNRINEIIEHLSSSEPRDTIQTTRHKKDPKYREALKFLLQKEYENIKGTKINYEHVTSSEDVIEFFEVHSEKEILTHTTKIDLKLLYSLLTGEHRELNGNKADMLQIIKRNIRARKRGEAFSR